MIKLEDIDSLVFNGGEVHVKNVPEIDILFAKIRNSEDLMKLLLVTDAHKREYGHNFKLLMPYIPYARQDRVANEGEALSIKVFSDLINTQNYEQVYVLDPHSDTCMATLNNVKEIAKINDEYLAKVIPHYEEVIVVAPDAGAFKRLSKTIKRVPLIYATKNRNTVTGELSNVEIHTGGISIAGKRLLIVDDICDGGGTFILLAKELNKVNNNPQIHFDSKLELYVTHGIFSKGVDELLKNYRIIYTTNSFNTIYNPNVIQYNIENILREV